MRLRGCLCFLRCGRWISFVLDSLQIQGVSPRRAPLCSRGCVGIWIPEDMRACAMLLVILLPFYDPPSTFRFLTYIGSYVDVFPHPFASRAHRGQTRISFIWCCRTLVGFSIVDFNNTPTSTYLVPPWFHRGFANVRIPSQNRHNMCTPWFTLSPVVPLLCKRQLHRHGPAPLRWF